MLGVQHARRSGGSVGWRVGSIRPRSAITSIGSTGQHGRSRGSREDAEDLVQDTYARVLARPRFLRREDDLGYLLRVLRNTFLNAKRTERRRPRTQPMAEGFEPVEERVSTRPDRVLETKEVFEAVAALADDFRDVVVAVDVVGLSYAETASALRVPQGTVMSRLYRGRQQVARQLGETGSSS
jgi:RNA polymerase sigma-70 factor (ECF subfamily)